MGGPDDRAARACESEPTDGAGQIALIGDVHSAWEFCDVAYFNRSQYELLLIAGDLGGSQARDGVRVASSMARLTRRALVMPGNNDVEEYGKIAAELTYRRGQADLLEDLLPMAAEPSELPRTCGYSLHRVTVRGLEVSILAARPFARGGCELSFPEALERSFGVRTLEESKAKLRELVDQVETEHLVFFAHNGPTGLGPARDDLWGRDFDPDQGDWGDLDLRDAVDYARERKRRTLAVVAGHMHWALRGGGQRRWQRQLDGVLYVNVARVPRVFDADSGRLRSHVSLALTRDG
ncbi:MAG TPA: hypothetical protein VGI70_01085, partial [Polyangiales bacterium]